MCPICRKEQLTLVSWVFGDHLGAGVGLGPHRRRVGLVGDPIPGVLGPRGGGMPHLQLESSGQVICARRGPPAQGHAARGRRATARARPVNNEGRHDQSSGDASGSETERVGKHADGDEGARSGPGQRRGAPRRPVDRDHPSRHRRPIAAPGRPHRRGQGRAGRFAAASTRTPAFSAPSSETRSTRSRPRWSARLSPSKPLLSQPGDRPGSGRRPPGGPPGGPPGAHRAALRLRPGPAAEHTRTEGEPGWPSRSTGSGCGAGCI